MRWKLGVALVFVVGVSGLDVWFCLLDADALRDIELNPLACMVIDWAGVYGLVSLKQVGLATVVVTLCELDRNRYLYRWWVVGAIVMVQSLVLGCYVARLAF
jgi:hypothetical protein